jgi:hypothetical protein
VVSGEWWVVSGEERAAVLSLAAARGRAKVEGAAMVRCHGELIARRGRHGEGSGEGGGEGGGEGSK